MVKWYCTRRPETGIWMSLAMSSNCLRRLSPLRTLERFELRTVMLCIFLVAGWSSPVFSQQLKAITNSIGMKLVLILPGEFIMGSPIKPQREVTISQWYYLAAHEVTQEQYEKVMGNNPSIFKGAKNPVEMVSLEDAVFFVKSCRRCRRRKWLDGSIGYRQKRCGSTLAVLQAAPHFVLETQRNRFLNLHGLVTVAARHSQWAKRKQIDGACTTCMEMSLSGARTGVLIT